MPVGREAGLDDVLESIRVGRLEEGEQGLRAMLERNSGSLEVLGHLAYLLYQQGRYAEAAIYYERCIDLAPDLVEAYCRASDCRFLAGDRRGAGDVLAPLMGTPAFELPVVQERLARSRPAVIRILTQTFKRSPDLFQKLRDRSLRAALLRELILIPQSIQGIRRSGTYAFLRYLSQGFLDRGVHRFPPQPCDLCGGNAFKGVFFENFRKVVRCAHCGLEKVERIPPGGQDVHSGYYDLDSNIAVEECEWRDPRRLRDQVRRLTDGFSAMEIPFPGRDWRVFEMGCGQGQLLHALAQAGVCVEGIDQSERLVEVGRREYGLNVYSSDVAALPEISEPYDLVIAFHVIEHLEHPSVLFQKARRYLRDGGFLHIETPIPDLYASPLGDQRHESLGYGSNEHTHYFTRKTLEAYCDRFGFQVVSRYEFPSGRIPIGGFLARKREEAAPTTSR